MYVFAHLGLGYALVKPWWRSVPLRALLLGSILPDLIDKPLYYGCVLWTGKRGADIGLISGTRTFGHTLIFLLLCCAISIGRKSKVGLALSAGVATHLFLDCVSVMVSSHGESYQEEALLFPLHGWSFPVMVYPGLGAQIGQWFKPQQLFFEGIGACILLWLFFRLLPKR